ncbi:MAG: hypothetical protein ACREDZ_04825 [Kiloniellales bacterium]
MTSTGLVIIPLGLLIILLPWRYSIAALLVFATMDSAAVVNVGSVGLQPGYFFGLLMIGRTAIEIALFRIPFNTQILTTLIPLLLFTVLAIASIWIGLTFFQGRIMVISSSASLDLDLAQPYMFQRQNLTQPFYLLLNVMILYATAHQLARLPALDAARAVDRAVVCAILFASAVAVWEMARFYAGVVFPASFFHSNAGYADAYGQVLAGTVLRVSGPFTEPAGLAYHFAGFLLFAWCRYLQRPNRPSSLLIVLVCLAMMAASTSTTAFAIMGLFALVVIKDGLSGTTSIAGKIRLSSGHLITLVLLGVAAAGAVVFIQSYWQYVDEVVTQMVLEKSRTSSFEQRTGVDLLAIDILIQTGGIGVGLGSHKPNNLAMTLLSNTGIAGFLTFAAFLFDVIRWPAGPDRRVVLRPFRWFVIGLLLVHLLANPNLGTAMLWISFALVIGTRCSHWDQLPAVLSLPVRRGQETAAFAPLQAYRGG